MRYDRRYVMGLAHTIYRSECGRLAWPSQSTALLRLNDAPTIARNGLSGGGFVRGASCAPHNPSHNVQSTTPVVDLRFDPRAKPPISPIQDAIRHADAAVIKRHLGCY